MSKRQQFIPGKNSNAFKTIHYKAIYNSLYPKKEQLNCSCISYYYNKNIVGSDSSSIRISKNERLSEIVNFYKGGKTQYGNFYLQQPLNINYLGRMEGMPGGSGQPPKNKF